VHREAESLAGLNSRVALTPGVRLVRYAILIQFLVSQFPLFTPGYTSNGWWFCSIERYRR
jgi:hypothetical protein